MDTCNEELIVLDGRWYCPIHDVDEDGKITWHSGTPSPAVCQRPKAARAKPKRKIFKDK